jgi:hypothetical protein
MPGTTPRALIWVIGIGTKETTYGVAEVTTALTDWLAPDSADFAHRIQVYRDDSAEINGYIGATDHQIESVTADMARKFQASVESIGWATALQLGNVTTTGAADPYVSTAKWPTVCQLNPPSFTFVEGLNCAGFTGTFIEYKGAVIDQQVWTLSGKTFVQHEVAIKTDGSETAVPTFVMPATKKIVTKLVGSQVTSLKCDATLATDLSPLIRTAKITIASGVVVPPAVTSGIYVPEYQYGAMRPLLGVEFTIKADKSHPLYAAYTAKTVVKFNLTIDTGATPARSVSITCDQGIISDCAEKASGNETQLDVKYEAENNATDAGPAVIVTKCAQATYLVAA